MRAAPRRGLSGLGLAAALVLIWLLSWGDISVANVVSGIAVAAVLLVVFPMDRGVEASGRRFRPLAALRLLLAFGGELVLSNLQVATMVLGPCRTRTGIVACPLRVRSDGLATFLANLITISPGTLTVEVDHDAPAMYLHVLRLDDPESVRRKVARFELLAVRAYGSAADRATVEGDGGPR
jgi:multicomponent Na+:H+ antiporter subunit E